MTQQLVILVDDDAAVRDSTRAMLEVEGFTVHCYGTATRALQVPIPQNACLITDIRMPGMSGLELQEELVRRKINLPVIVITGHGDVPLAVRAMKAGALEFIEKPVDGGILITAIKNALALGIQCQTRESEIKDAQTTVRRLTPREREILEKLTNGLSNKVAAHELGISPRTVELHRSHIMKKLKVKNLSAMVRLALTAEGRV